MKKMILLFSHTLNESQIQYATSNYNIEEFISLPKNLQEAWSHISPDLKSIAGTLKVFKTFLLENTKKKDYVLVQGDFGAVYNMVNFCIDNDLIPIYATTLRESKEFKEGEKMVKKSIFTFKRFREYE